MPPSRVGRQLEQRGISVYVAPFGQPFQHQLRICVAVHAQAIGMRSKQLPKCLGGLAVTSRMLKHLSGDHKIRDAIFELVAQAAQIKEKARIDRLPISSN